MGDSWMPADPPFFNWDERQPPFQSFFPLDEPRPLTANERAVIDFSLLEPLTRDKLEIWNVTSGRASNPVASSLRHDPL